MVINTKLNIPKELEEAATEVIVSDYEYETLKLEILEEEFGVDAEGKLTNEQKKDFEEIMEGVKLVIEAKDNTVNHHYKDELILHANNDRDLYEKSHKPIIANLKKKMTKGVYDSNKATKLWKYHIDRSHDSLVKNHGYNRTNVATRNAAAAELEARHREELKD